MIDLGRIRQVMENRPIEQAPVQSSSNGTRFTSDIELGVSAGQHDPRN